MQITIDINKLSEIYQNADKLALTDDASDYIEALLYIHWLSEKYIDNTKEQIAIKGNKMMPNFKGFVGRDIKGFYRQYGAKYYTNDTEQVDDEFKEKKVTYTIKSKEVDDYVKEHGTLPDGVFESDRAKKLSLVAKPLLEKFEKEDYKLPAGLTTRESLSAKEILEIGETINDTH